MQTSRRILMAGVALVTTFSVPCLAQPAPQPTEPEVQPILQPEVQSAVQLEVQPTLQLIVQPAFRPRVQSTLQSEVQPRLQSEVQPVVQPEVQPEVQLTVQLPAQPAAPTLPDGLAPNPDLLDRPTEPDAVQVRRTESLTLAQVLALAERQNRLLQIARLQVEVLRASKRELQATQLPNLVIGAGLIHQSLPEANYLNEQIQALPDELRTLTEDQLNALIAQRFRPLTDRELLILNNFVDRVNTLTEEALSNVEDNTSLRNLTRSSSTPLTASVTLNYNLDLWGGRAAAIQAVDKQLQVSELEVDRQTEDIKLLVTLEYYALQESDQLVRIAQDALNNAAAVLRDAQGLSAAGVGTNLDVQRTQVLVSNIQQDLALALTLQKNVRRRLAQRLTLPASVNITAADPVKTAGAWPLPLEDSIVEAFANRSELDELLLEREATQSQRRVQQALNRPIVNLFANYRVLNVLDSDPNPGFVDGYALGGTLLWNLYDGGATRARLNRQENLQAILETQFAETRDLIRLEVERSYNDLQVNQSNIQTALTALDKAQEVLRLSRIGFQAGVVTQLEVTTAQTELTRTETNLVRSVLNYNRALVILQRAVALPGSESSESDDVTIPID